MASLRLALAQLNVTVGDLEGNRLLVEGAIRQAQAWRADVVIVPELAMTGYPPEDLLLKPHFVAANRRALARVTPLTRGIVAIIGFVDEDQHGRLYNAAAVLAHGRHAATYHKQHLPNYGVFDEQRYFTPGTGSPVFEAGGIRFGLTICEDLWMDAPCRHLAAAGAQLVLNLSASPYHAGKLLEREQLFSRRARHNRLAVACCNLVGGQDELVFDGGSLVLDAQGGEVARAAQFREELLMADLHRAELGPPKRVSVPPLAVTGVLPGRPPLPRTRPAPLGRAEEVYGALMVGLRDYVRKNGFSTVVLGLSGGVDSALTACIAVDALGAEAVRGMVMPSRFSSAQTQADARQIGRALGIEVREVSIEPVFTAYLRTLNPHFASQPPGVAEQNIQARIRGNLLMALSNQFGWLVLTTGNKSEYATGYCTLYGDMAGGFAVIKDVPKTLVYELARFRNRRGPGHPIPASVMRRAPTAELAPHQRDQDTLPPYGLLDRVLQAYVEEDQGVAEIVARQRIEAETPQRVIRMVDRAEYKRRQAPPGVKITPRAFGKDRRMPLTNRYQDG